MIIMIIMMIMMIMIIMIIVIIMIMIIPQPPAQRHRAALRRPRAAATSIRKLSQRRIRGRKAKEHTSKKAKMTDD